jgi:hypothetical protein
MTKILLGLMAMGMMSQAFAQPDPSDRDDRTTATASQRKKAAMDEQDPPKPKVHHSTKTPSTSSKPAGHDDQQKTDSTVRALIVQDLKDHPNPTAHALTKSSIQASLDQDKANKIKLTHQLTISGIDSTTEDARKQAIKSQQNRNIANDAPNAPQVKYGGMIPTPQRLHMTNDGLDPYAERSPQVEKIAPDLKESSSSAEDHPSPQQDPNHQ